MDAASQGSFEGKILGQTEKNELPAWPGGDPTQLDQDCHLYDPGRNRKFKTKNAT